MMAQTVDHGYINSYSCDELVYNDMKHIPYHQTQMDFPYQCQGHEVRIAQQEENTFGNGGIWGLEHMLAEEVQKPYPEALPYSRSQQPLESAFLQTSYFSQPRFYLDPAAQPTNSEMVSYSNDSSPFLSNLPLPSAPRTPVTPAATPLLNGQYYTAPGVPGAFLLVPVVAQDPEGNMTTVFFPKQTLLEPCMDMNYTIEFHNPGLGDGAGVVSNTRSHYTPQQQQPFDYTEEKLAMEEIPDDGPELFGMGLYDEPPELLYSTATTPELARLSTPGIYNDGRGLVLEQSFGLPEDDEDDEYDGEEEYEYKEEE